MYAIFQKFKHFLISLFITAPKQLTSTVSTPSNDTMDVYRQAASNKSKVEISSIDVKADADIVIAKLKKLNDKKQDTKKIIADIEQIENLIEKTDIGKILGDITITQDTGATASDQEIYANYSALCCTIMIYRVNRSLGSCTHVCDSETFHMHSCHAELWSAFIKALKYKLDTIGSD